MTSVTSIRLLSLFGFLILITPFYDQCNGRGMKHAEVEAAEAIDSTAVVIEEEYIDESSKKIKSKILLMLTMKI